MTNPTVVFERPGEVIVEDRLMPEVGPDAGDGSGAGVDLTPFLTKEACHENH